MRAKSIIISTLAVLSLSSATLSSCKKDDETTPITTTPQTNNVDPYGKIAVTFTNEVDGQTLNTDGTWYTNPNGNPYNISLLKYYVTNFTLVKDDGSERNFKTYKLVDGADPASGKFTLDSVVNGNYTAVKFYLGVDPDRNHSGDQDGDLDPIHGMIWTWNTGYIFFKHEGQYKDGSGATKNLLLHLGTDVALASITVPVTKLEVKGNTRNLFLKLNLNSLYSSPNNIDFNTDNNRMSTSAADRSWISDMRTNAGDAFTLSKVE